MVLFEVYENDLSLYVQKIKMRPPSMLSIQLYPFHKEKYLKSLKCSENWYSTPSEEPFLGSYYRRERSTLRVRLRNLYRKSKCSGCQVDILFTKQMDFRIFLWTLVLCKTYYVLKAPIPTLLRPTEELSVKPKEYRFQFLRFSFLVADSGDGALRWTSKAHVIQLLCSA